MTKYVDFPFKTISVSDADFILPRAIEFLNAAKKGSIFNVIECRRTEEASEIVIGWMVVSVGQNPTNDIRFNEKLAILFEKEDDKCPWVFALREDFPKLIHLNLFHFEKPLSLCIYEKSFDELKLDWRSIQFIEDIGNWLSLSSSDTLHKDDQPLEPFLLHSDGVVSLPIDVEEVDKLHLYCVSKNNSEMNFIALKDKLEGEGIIDTEYFPLIVKGDSQEHGILDKHPQNLFELSEFLQKAEINLFEILKGQILANKDKANLRLFIVAVLPKTTTSDKITSDFDHYVFVVFENVENIGIKLNIWEKHDGQLADLLNSVLTPENTKNIKIGTLKPVIEFSKDQAALFNGVKKSEGELEIALIGSGALGSQIFMGMSRMGIGKWTILDDDILLPHNLARHALSKSNVCLPKSQSTSFLANTLVNDDDHSTWIWDNILRPKDAEKIKDAFKKADVILDISTSISVEREITDEKYGDGRRLSIFLNPSGRDLVILAEDLDRTCTLDVLEFQYYKGIIKNSALSDHMKKEVDSIRYSNSCRDISNRIPNERVSLLSSIATNQLQAICSNQFSKIGVWQINEYDFSVKHMSIASPTVFIEKIGDWEIIIDVNLLELITESRLRKLPNETGGILIGGYDLFRKKIFVMDTILSPKDSHEYPTAYIRGIEGVKKELLRISEVTNDQLKYIGEWHSHPSGASLGQSTDDKKLFSWLRTEMDEIGLPALMLILGADRSFQLYCE